MASLFTTSPMKKTHPPPLPPHPVHIPPQNINVSSGYTDAHPSDDDMFKRRYTAIQDIINELEDENNLIAYRIAKIKKERIEAERAAIAQAEAEAEAEAQAQAQAQAQAHFEAKAEAEAERVRQQKMEYDNDRLEDEDQEDIDELDVIGNDPETERSHDIPQDDEDIDMDDY
ncbi:uncharacterized protein IL334_000076 [Kwoniella shivajii]|uniref:Uncharacterized protein n=1 Tax=Kwoniella shivajii TaxID=564305 RepID=A0ABZ1CN48_9TREE|nr:hypothetical protein IL334_000076 [Kwoniella shivajii]